MPGVRFKLEYSVDGTVLDGVHDLRQYAVIETQIVMTLDTTQDLHLRMHPDIAEYRYDEDTVDVVIPLLSAGWITVPFRLREKPRLERVCETGELRVRVETANERRVFRATDTSSPRWRTDNPAEWSPAPTRDRLLIRVGRDGELSEHPAAARVGPIREPDADPVIFLDGLILPRRTTCVFCDAPDPDTREHALPQWATSDGGMGTTVSACTECNNGLSDLEDQVSQISRRGSPDLSHLGRSLVGLWAIKTIWVVGKALGFDPLLGAGDEWLPVLVAAPGPKTASAFTLGDVYSSVESSTSRSFVQYSDPTIGRPWAMLRVANLATSVWLEPAGHAPAVESLKP